MSKLLTTEIDIEIISVVFYNKCLMIIFLIYKIILTKSFQNFLDFMVPKIGNKNLVYNVIIFFCASS